ncbi:MAG: tetratricopeptide repeat protein [Flavobacteriaceae bacterium]|nr:tetratricopeptide repeat protein [Flavobacteriaceae bacterium]
MNRGVSMIFFKTLLTSIIIFSHLNTLTAQIPSDSLKLIWTDVNKSDSIRFKSISEFYYIKTYAQPDSIILLTKYHYNLAQQKNNTKQMANALNERSYAYYVKGDLNKSSEILKQSIELFKLINEPKNLAVIQSNLGFIYFEEKKYLEAFLSFNESLKFIKKENLKTSESRLLTKLGEIYSILDELDLAMNYFNEAESICMATEVNKKNQLGSILENKAEVYYRLKNFKLAIDYSKKAIKEFNQSNNKYEIATCYLLMAKSYNQINDEIKSSENVEKSLQISYELNNNSKIIKALLLKFNIIYNSNPLKALEGAENILKLITKQTSNETKVELYELLYKCYKYNNQADLALLMIEEKSKCNDIIQLENNRIFIIKQTIKNDYQHQLEINNEIKNNEKDILKKTFTERIIGAVVLMLIIFTLLIISHRRKNLINMKSLENLLIEIDALKRKEKINLIIESKNYSLNKNKIESFINKKLNKTDWEVLNILLENPEITNKAISDLAFLSIDGIGSSLRRMYVYFDITETNYKKVVLIKKAIEISNSN